MSLFENLLEIKTGRKSHVIKAVYIPNSVMWWDGTYYLYYYDMVNNTFYVNDLDYIWTKDRASAINIIEHIINRAYKLEMNSFIDIIKKVQITKKPNVYYFYRQKQTRVIIIDKVNLVAKRDKTWVIVWFKNPSWDKWNTQKIKEDDVILCKI